MNKYDNELSRKIENDESLEDALILLDDMLSRVKPKLKDNAHLYIFCSWKNFAEFKEVVSNHFKVKNALIWNKELFGMGDLKGNYADTYEMIIFAGGNREFVKRPGNIITCRFDEERLHNTQKPVDLLSELIENSTDAGDLIFDPFLGSGSTAVASKKLNRNYSGCELDEQNYKITLKRLADE
jgi:site-specific DNA-methyltransferase (adenine-specific)